MIKLIFFTLSLATVGTLSGQDSIRWPEAYEPSRSRFYVHNEIEIKAPPERVWAILIDALQWENWYKGAKNVSFLDKSQGVLQPNTVIDWRTMGLHFRSEVREFTPNRLLAWESRKRSIQGYHVWLIVPTATGCRVITDESQNGWLTFFEKTFQRRKLQHLHDVWLKALQQKAETEQQL